MTERLCHSPLSPLFNKSLTTLWSTKTTLSPCSLTQRKESLAFETSSPRHMERNFSGRVPLMLNVVVLRAPESLMCTSEVNFIDSVLYVNTESELSYKIHLSMQNTPQPANWWSFHQGLKQTLEALSANLRNFDQICIFLVTATTALTMARYKTRS